MEFLPDWTETQSGYSDSTGTDSNLHVQLLLHQRIVLVVTSAVSRIAKGVLRLAWPVLVAQLAVIASGVLDTVMAGRYSAVGPGAVRVGASVYFSVFLGVVGGDRKSVVLGKR